MSATQGRKPGQGSGTAADLSSDGPWFGAFGGRFVPETLVPALAELETAYDEAMADEEFLSEFDEYNSLYGGRPTPLYHARRLSAHARDGADGGDGPELYLKREDLVHGGAHKFNNVMGQGLLARYMGKERLIAETGAGQHGVATAMAGAVLGLPTEVYMGAVDAKRQELNVFRMKLLGAEVHVVEAGARTLKDAINEALRDWVTNVETTHYCLGSVVGPHPYPRLVRDLQSVIGEEVRSDCEERLGRLPSALVACVGGGSNAMGTFHPFRDDEDVDLVGVEAGGDGTGTERHAASLVVGEPGVLHGARSYLLQDEDGQVLEAHSVSAGLDYPGVGPEHALFKDLGRARYVAVDDEQALEATKLLSRLEGIIPALEPAHAVAHAVEMARSGEYGADDVIVVTLSGRGDKDMGTLVGELGLDGDGDDAEDRP